MLQVTEHGGQLGAVAPSGPQALVSSSAHDETEPPPSQCTLQSCSGRGQASPGADLAVRSSQAAQVYYACGNSLATGGLILVLHALTRGLIARTWKQVVHARPVHHGLHGVGDSFPPRALRHAWLPRIHQTDFEGVVHTSAPLAL
jgi:hypothetical protein